MKYIMIVMVSMLAFPFVSSAANCPKLEGTYTCNYEGTELEVNVSERARTGYTSYVVDYGMGTITLHPDGIQHFIDRLPGVESMHKFRYKGYCKGSSVTFSGSGEMVDGSGNGTMSGSVSKQGGGLLINVSVKGGGRNENVRLVCK